MNFATDADPGGGHSASSPCQDIAIVGSGIAGMSAAWLLSQTHSVTVFERDTRIGGHSNTVVVKKAGIRIPVDTGFIVYNDETYPNLVALFSHLKVPTEASDMSFAVSVDNGSLEYGSGSLNAMLGQRRNILTPRYWRMVLDIKRFFQQATKFLDQKTPDETLNLGDFLAQHGFQGDMADRFILPMGGAIWSTKPAAMKEQPAITFLRFLESHGLLKFTGQYPWRTVTGGSRAYVERLTADYIDRVNVGRGVTEIKRLDNGVAITDKSGRTTQHDAVVIATHANEALNLLSDPDPTEKRLLHAFQYTDNRVILHSDPSLMPHRKRIWSSWNFMGQDDAGVSVTYWMNKLQSLDNRQPLFVSVNPVREPITNAVYRSFNYQHPFFDLASWQAQKDLWQLQGNRNTWFCGSYFGAGFHEDALQSGLAVAEELGGVKRPWQVKNDSGRIYRGVNKKVVAA